MAESFRWAGLPAAQRHFLVDGKMLRVRDALAFEDLNGNELAKIRSRAVSIRDKIEVERTGAPSGALTTDLITIMGVDFMFKLDDGRELTLEGSFLDHEYSFVEGEAADA